jgi:hypothetical protein
MLVLVLIPAVMATIGVVREKETGSIAPELGYSETNPKFWTVPISCTLGFL